jgi:hypothetical protein
VKVTVEPTDKAVVLRPRGSAERVPARIWQGFTEGGVPVRLLVVRLAVPNGLEAEVYAAFEALLAEVGPFDSINIAMEVALR